MSSYGTRSTGRVRLTKEQQEHLGPNEKFSEQFKESDDSEVELSVPKRKRLTKPGAKNGKSRRKVVEDDEDQPKTRSPKRVQISQLFEDEAEEHEAEEDEAEEVQSEVQQPVDQQPSATLLYDVKQERQQIKKANTLASRPLGVFKSHLLNATRDFYKHTSLKYTYSNQQGKLETTYPTQPNLITVAILKRTCEDEDKDEEPEEKFYIFGTSWLLKEFPLVHQDSESYATTSGSYYENLSRADNDMPNWMSYVQFPLDTVREKGRCAQVLYNLQTFTHHLVVVPVAFTKFLAGKVSLKDVSRSKYTVLAYDKQHDKAHLAAIKEKNGDYVKHLDNKRDLVNFFRAYCAFKDKPAKLDQLMLRKRPLLRRFHQVHQQTPMDKYIISYKNGSRGFVHAPIGINMLLGKDDRGNFTWFPFHQKTNYEGNSEQEDTETVGPNDLEGPVPVYDIDD